MAASVPGRETPDAPFRQLAPAAGPEPSFQPPQWKRFKLKNGLEVVLVEFHDLPLVDLNLMIKTGGAANPPDRAGLAELTAHMLDEGTKTRSALAIADKSRRSARRCRPAAPGTPPTSACRREPGTSTRRWPCSPT